MDTPPSPAGALCSAYNEPLLADGSRLTCLLRGGLEETAAEGPPPAPPRYGDFTGCARRARKRGDTLALHIGGRLGRATRGGEENC